MWIVAPEPIKPTATKTSGAIATVPPPANSPTMYTTLVYQDRYVGLGKPAYSQKKKKWIYIYKSFKSPIKRVI